MASDRRTAIEHNRKEQAKRDRWTRQEIITDAIENCSRALERAGKIDAPGGQEWYDFVEEECRTVLLPQLQAHTGSDLLDYRASDADAVIDRKHRLDEFMSVRPGGFTPTDPGSRRLLVDAFHVLAEIAESEDLIEDELRNRVDTVGFSVKIGEHIQNWQMDFGDPVKGVTKQAGTLKTLFTGGTGMGKSAALETEAEDFYQQNFEDGRDYKLLDIVGMRDGENWFYDVPQQQDSLRHEREEMDLPPDFTEGDAYEEPTIEILVPLTPGLPKQKLPFDTEDERFTVRPFTVPASELRKPLLVALIMSRVSDQEENTIRQAFDDVTRRSSDWALRDLADEIMERQELGPKHKSNAVGVLRSLQDVGFIRTKDSDYTITWRDVFEDTETITVFSQAFCDDEIGKLACIAYLFDAIVDKREQMYDIPQCVLLMRELWKITPHSKRQEDDARAASIQETITARMTKVLRENRHHGIHVLADTQWPSDLNIAVRRNFNRYVVFGGRYELMKDIFQWTQNGKYQSFYQTMTAKTGEAGIVGQVEPAINRREIEYLSPISYAPPSHHHRATYGVENGWRGRVRFLDREDLEYPASIEGIDWPDSLPAHLQLAEQGGDEDSGPSPKLAPVVAFAEECLEYAGAERTEKRLIKLAFNQFLDDHDIDAWDFDDRGRQTTFGSRLKDHMPGELKNTAKNGESAYGNVRLTPAGEDYAKSAMD